KVSRAAVSVRLKEIRDDADAAAEASVLDTWLKLSNRQGVLKRNLKEAEEHLDALARGKYPTLAEEEIRGLVVDDKWLAALEASVQGEMDRISQALAGRVKELAERYETPLPQLDARVRELEEKVARHLETMGFSWD